MAVEKEGWIGEQPLTGGGFGRPVRDDLSIAQWQISKS
jgi:hypothetical protein